MIKQELLEKLKSNGFSSNIVNAFSKVKREDFVPKGYRHLAYKDIALPIEYNQTISQPFTIAIMLSLLDLKQDQKVLEIGSGCGYVLALLSEIVGKKTQVFGVEIIQGLAEESSENLANQGYRNVQVHNRNGRLGLSKQAPFDRILISAALDDIPRNILDQLKNKGILIAPVGDRKLQSLVVIQKVKDKFIVKNEIPGFVFVPFVEE